MSERLTPRQRMVLRALVPFGSTVLIARAVPSAGPRTDAQVLALTRVGHSLAARGLLQGVLVDAAWHFQLTDRGREAAARVATTRAGGVENFKGAAGARKR